MLVKDETSTPLPTESRMDSPVDSQSDGGRKIREYLKSKYEAKKGKGNSDVTEISGTKGTVGQRSTLTEKGRSHQDRQSESALSYPPSTGARGKETVLKSPVCASCIKIVEPPRDKLTNLLQPSSYVDYDGSYSHSQARDTVCQHRGHRNQAYSLICPRVRGRNGMVFEVLHREL